MLSLIMLTSLRKKQTMINREINKILERLIAKIFFSGIQIEKKMFG